MRIPCTHQAPQSCPECDGTEQEAARGEHIHLVHWWLCNKARLPEGYRPRPVGRPAPREDPA